MAILGGGRAHHWGAELRIGGGRGPTQKYINRHPWLHAVTSAVGESFDCAWKRQYSETLISALDYGCKTKLFLLFITENLIDFQPIYTKNNLKFRNCPWPSVRPFVTIVTRPGPQYHGRRPAYRDGRPQVYSSTFHSMFTRIRAWQHLTIKHFYCKRFLSVNHCPCFYIFIFFLA